MAPFTWSSVIGYSENFPSALRASVARVGLGISVTPLHAQPEDPSEPLLEPLTRAPEPLQEGRADVLVEPPLGDPRQDSPGEPHEGFRDRPPAELLRVRF